MKCGIMYGKTNDELAVRNSSDVYFIRFINDKENDDLKGLEALLEELDELPDSSRNELSELYKDVVDSIKEMKEELGEIENDYEIYA